MPEEISRAARKLTLLDALIAVLVLAAVLTQAPHTLNQIGPSWDEPVYFHSVKNYAAWFKSIGQGKAFNHYTLESVFDLGLFTDCSPTAYHFLRSPLDRLHRLHSYCLSFSPFTA